MLSQAADSIHLTRTLIRSGVIRPSRPDRVARTLVGLHRWGPTLAAGYLGAAARYPDRLAIRDELGAVTFAELHGRTNALAHSLASGGWARARVSRSCAAITADSSRPASPARSWARMRCT